MQSFLETTGLVNEHIQSFNHFVGTGASYNWIIFFQMKNANYDAISKLYHPPSVMNHHFLSGNYSIDHQPVCLKTLKVSMIGTLLATYLGDFLTL